MPVNLVRWPVKQIVRNSCPTLFAAPDTLHPKFLYQPLDGTAGNTIAFSQQLPPYFANTINPEVAFLNPLYIQFQLHVPLDAIRQSIRISLAPFVFVAARRGNLYLFANWLDPVFCFVAIDKCHHYFGRRSSVLSQNRPILYAISCWLALIPDSPVPIP